MQKAAPPLLCCSNKCESPEAFHFRREQILPLFASLLILGIILYLLGWVTKVEVGKAAAWIRKSSAILVVSGAALVLTRNIGLAILAGMIAYSVMQRTGWYPGKGRRAAGGNASAVRSRYLEMSMDRATGAITGRVLQGRFAGRALSDFTNVERTDFLSELAVYDPQGAQLFEAYLDRSAPGWRNNGDKGPAGARSSRAMTLDEAYLVLGLNRRATREDVLAAHRNLMKRFHPDQGGTTYLAAQVNEAKDLLLKHIAV